MTRSKLQAWLWGVAGLALVIRTSVRDRGVIYDHLEFGRRLVSGSDLYAPFLDAPRPLHPVYPPSFGLMTWPFTLVPDAVARAAWAVVQVAALAWIGVILVRALRAHWPELAHRSQLALFLTLLLAARYVLRDTAGGGGNIINTALVLGSFSLATNNRPALSGVTLGLSLATKPTAVLFVPLLWLCGHRKPALLACSAALGLLAAALLIHGHGLAPLEIWARGSIAYSRMPTLFATPDGGFPPFSWMNQCLRCAVERFAGTVPEQFVPLSKRDGAEIWFFQGLGLGTTAVLWIRNLLSAAILGATFWVAWRRRSAPATRLTTIAACFAASLLLSPISWKAHHVALIPALFLLVIACIRGRAWAWILAATYAATCVLGEEIVGKDFKEVQQHLYLVTFGTIVMWVLSLGRGFSPPER